MRPLSSALAALLLLGAPGCWYVDDARYRDEVMDADGDGGISERFGGPDCADADPAIADCDADADGHRAAAVGGDDCDDADPAVLPTSWYRDVDGDGAGDGDDAVTGCGAVSAGWSLVSGDCAPTDAAISPFAAESCDPEDRNCDGDPIGGAADGAVTVWADADGDGWGSVPLSGLRCGPAPGESPYPGDCDDADAAVSPGAPEGFHDGVDQNCDPSDEDDADGDGSDALAYGGDDCDDARADVYPGAPELCDGIDDDCDGLVDDEEDDADQAGVLVPWWQDGDRDGWGGETLALYCPSATPDGWSRANGDCDDALGEVHPEADERCDGIDDDCDGLTDEGGSLDELTAWVDLDHDGWGGLALTTCDLGQDLDGDGTADLVLIGGDCDDGLPDAHPGAPEICGDSVRQDCTDADPDDCDADGYLSADDCDDARADVNPAADEACNGIDDDCDARIDDDDPEITADDYRDFWFDDDGDGWGGPYLAAAATCAPPADGVLSTGDCDDGRPSAYPGADETCNGADDDCDLETDEDAVNAPTWYVDADADGSGAPAGPLVQCDAPLDGVPLGDDCDDDDPLRGPLLDELCDDAIDNDCDGAIDLADPDASIDDGDLWWCDGDGDGVGAGDPLRACGDPSNGLCVYVQVDADCDDTNPMLRAGGLWFADADGDGWGSTTGVWACAPPAGFVDRPGDCAPDRADIHPELDDLCDNTDNDCDGAVDEDPGEDLGALTLWPDQDDDGHGDTFAAPLASCFVMPGWADDDLDCDDASAAAWTGYPGELCDGVDNDCDGLTDSADPEAGVGLWYYDADGDGFGAGAAVATCDPPGPDYALEDGDCVDTDPGAQACPVPATCGWRYTDADGDGWAPLDAAPVWNCSSDKRPRLGDCDDHDSLAPMITQVDTVLGLRDAAGKGCVVAAVSQPLDLTVAVTVPVGSHVTITSLDPSNPTTLTLNTMWEVSGALAFDRVNLVGGGQDLLNVNTGGGPLGLVDTFVDGNLGRVILGEGGDVWLAGAEIIDAEDSLYGGALSMMGYAPGTVTVRDSWLHGNVGAYTLWTARPTTLDGARIEDGPGIYADALLTMTDSELWRAFGIGLTLDPNAGGSLLTRTVIADSGGDGVHTRHSSGTLTLDHLTVVGNGSRGLFTDPTAGTVTLKGSAVLGNGTSWNKTPSLDADTVYDAILPYDVTTFVTWDPLLPSALWDLHVPIDSALYGAAGGSDLGAYAQDDAYYDDTDNDGVPDGWVLGWYGVLIEDIDTDGDGLKLSEEYVRGTSPILKNTDGDTAGDDNLDTAPLHPL